MAVAKQAYGLADYLMIDSKWELMRHFTSVPESPNAQTEETQYTIDKTIKTETVGYQPSWGIEGIQHKDEEGDEVASAKAVERLEKIGKEQLLGTAAQLDFCRVELDNPIASKENTFYARKCKVSVEISELGNEAGSKRAISGNLNAIEDIIIGEFNTKTLTFTPASEVI